MQHFSVHFYLTVVHLYLLNYLKDLQMNFSIANNNFISVNKDKNDLYVCNTTIRNLARSFDFLNLAESIKKTGILNNKAFLDFVSKQQNQIVTTEDSENSTADENKVKAFTRRFSELNLLGLIDYSHKDGEFNFSATNSKTINFTPKGLPEDKSSSEYKEVLSNFILYVLKERNTLNTVFSLFSELSKTQQNNKDLFYVNAELAYIYASLPIWKKSYNNQTKYIAEEIKSLRVSFNKIKGYALANSVKSLQALDYKGFLASQFETSALNSKIQGLVTFKTAYEYIDMTVRCLIQSGCFTKIKAKDNEFNCVGVKINGAFESKLVFFVQNTFSELKELYQHKTLNEQLVSFELHYLNKQNGVVIEDPITYRYQEAA